ncbi:GNAT family N-acetyltransferase [Legionella sp. W05-934-2]|jgi:GNAT superfamily N-acetyltransferase|uniref:GNAT family N-acetyltransferase n=1 Tax=Legionella sp. W05-934-2 TaxID=1198649 RepID=UPI0034622DE1
MAENYIVRRMVRPEIDTAIEWAAAEGWNPGLHDADCFFATDPHGFFAGLVDDQIIAVGSAVRYDNHFAFCGFYIVASDFRGQGYGLKLTKKRLEYVGSRNAGIDGVTNMLDKYARLGYKIAHNNARYEVAKLPSFPINHKAIKPIEPRHLPTLFDYDRQHFPAERPVFLKAWVNQPNSLSLVWIEDNEIKGYGVIRACRKGFKIGPLFANTPAIADQLFQALANHAHGETVILDIPENNKHARALVGHYQMEKVFETARMYLKGQPNLKDAQIYGITTFELG